MRINTMENQTMRKQHEQWLLELTGMPSAAGREDAVVAYLKQWVRVRKQLVMREDEHGNVIIARKNSFKKTASKQHESREASAVQGPLYLQAHMDHPSFVVCEVVGPRVVLAEFRGGVNQSYFAGTGVLLHGSGKPARGKVLSFETQPKRTNPLLDENRKILRVTFSRDVQARPGDVMTWDTGKARITRGRLHAPGCDDQAAVAAALSAYDQWLGLPAGKRGRADVRLFFTRAEEAGFVGTLAACRTGTLEKNARIICLENSKSFPESPIGGGPIVRVGDRTSTFDPELTFRCSRIADDLQEEDAAFLYQRKLMAGGTCEATAYQTYGYQATCLCLPLGNYHNMNEATGRIDAEIISVEDYHGLIRLLVGIVTRLDNPDSSPSLMSRLESIYETRKYVLDPF